MTHFILGILTTVVIPWLPAFLLSVLVGIAISVFVLWAMNAMHPQPVRRPARSRRERVLYLTDYGRSLTVGRG